MNQITEETFGDIRMLGARLAVLAAANIVYLRRAAGVFSLGTAHIPSTLADKWHAVVSPGPVGADELMYMGRGAACTVVEAVGFSDDEVGLLVQAFDPMLKKTKTRDVYTARVLESAGARLYFDDGSVWHVDPSEARSVRSIGGHLVALRRHGLAVAVQSPGTLQWVSTTHVNDAALGSMPRVCHFSERARIGRPISAGTNCWRLHVFDERVDYEVVVFTSDNTFMITRNTDAPALRVGTYGGDPATQRVVFVEGRRAAKEVTITVGPDQGRGRRQ